MTAGHISTEALSAYLDGETAPDEARRLSSHLDACDSCRRRFESVRRLVGGLRRLAPAEPPASLAASLRGRLAAEAGAAAVAGSGSHPPGDPGPPSPVSLLGIGPVLSLGLRRLRALASWIWWRDLPPMRSRSGGLRLLSPAGLAGLALLGAVLLLENGSGAGMASFYPEAPRTGPEFLVSEAFGDASVVLPQTTSEVAGRVFVWSDDDVWVQRGIDASEARQPRAVPARSAAGRELLAKLSDLDVLLDGGSRVVLRYNFETLELWNGS
jgi:anti-sigma factor RsiW